MSDVVTQASLEGWQKLMRAAGIVDPPQEVLVRDVCWLPEATVSVNSWSGSVGSTVAPGTALGVVRPRVQAIRLAPSEFEGHVEADRVLSLFGISVAVAGSDLKLTGDDLRAVENSEGFNRILAQPPPYMAEATIRLAQPQVVTRIPPGALFATSAQDGCVLSDGKPVAVRVVASALGATLVIPKAPVNLTKVAVGAGITASTC